MGMFPILEQLFPIIGEVVDRVVPDKAGAEKAKRDIEAKLVDAAVSGQLAQIEVNKAEAANTNLFVSGWRPGIGWVCVAALAYQYVVTPVAMWGATWSGFDVPMPPKLDDILWELMFGMLGMGGLRTFEKYKGVASK